MPRHTLSIFVLALVLLASVPPGLRAASFIRSDVNQNGRLDLADPLRALEYLIRGRSPLGCLDAIDANDDGEADLSDVIYPFVFLFLGGPPPAAPYPDCGEDPTEDDLGCDRFDSCEPVVPNIRDVLGDCGGVPTTQYPNSLSRGDDLHKVTLHGARAVCNDGSPGVFFVRPAPADSPNVDRWVIYLQGGGSCSTFEECLERWCHIGTKYDESKMSSRYTPASVGATGIFARVDENAFGDFNQVFLYYCSSDSWTGRADDSVLTDPDDPGRAFSMRYRGHSILEAALRALMPGGIASDDREVVMPPLEVAELVLVTGFSAGSGGVHHNGDWIASLLEQNETRVRLVRDAGFTPPAETHPDPVAAEELAAELELLYRHAWDVTFSPEVWNSFTDESCRAALEGTEDAWRCADKSYVALNFVTTPYFVHMDLLDHGSRSKYEELGVTARDYGVMVRRTLLGLADLPANAIESDSVTRAPGAMGTLCGDHVGLMNNSVFYARTVEDADGIPASYHDLLASWLAGTDVYVVDDPGHRTTVCGPEQPENE